MSNEKRLRHRRSLAGTGLYEHGNGSYYWRRKDPTTGKRLSKCVGTRLDTALRAAADLDRELKARVEGRPTEDSWDRPLEPLIEEYLATRRYRSPRTAQNSAMRLRRVVGLLGLNVAGDLRALARISRELEAVKGESWQNVRRGYQEPLKRFSAWLAENNRVVDYDPLRSWSPISFDRSSTSRRSMLPPEYSRALMALDYLGEVHGHDVPQRLLFVCLLVTGARPGALTSRSTADFERSRPGIDLGADVGKKRRGAAALDPRTAQELAVASVERTGSAPLFPGPRGGSQDPSRARDLWLQAASLATVDELWPRGAPRDLALAHRVSRALLAGVVSVKARGRPRRSRPKECAGLDALRSQVAGLVERIRPEWEARREGLTLASIRKTTHTWAKVLGVPAPAIDKQLGHSDYGGDADVAKAIVGSKTGRRHYLDLHSKLIDPAQTAVAVRERLDEAEAELLADASSLLVGGASATAGPWPWPPAPARRRPVGASNSARRRLRREPG